MQSLGNLLERMELGAKRKSQAGPVHLPDVEYEGDDCPMCGGMGFFTYNVPLGDERFGKAYPCLKCRLGREMHEKRMRKNVVGSGIDGEYQGYTLATWDLELTEEQRREKTMARWMAEQVLDHRCGEWEVQGFWAAGIVMASAGFGYGKTGLMAAIANGLALQGQRILWINMSRLWKTVRGTYERDPEKQPDVPEWKIMQEIQDAEVLFLDDVNWAQNGEADQTASPAAVRFFTDVVRVRHDLGKPYFMTTNHATKPSFQNEWKERACTVVFQDCHWVVLGGMKLRDETQAWDG